MIFLLLLLTTINFFIFSAESSGANPYALLTGQEEQPEAFPGSPAGPDEKSPTGPVSVSEEYLHGHDDHARPLLPDESFTHLVAESEKIELIHFELLSPPPEC